MAEPDAPPDPTIESHQKKSTMQKTRELNHAIQQVHGDLTINISPQFAVSLGKATTGVPQVPSTEEPITEKRKKRKLSRRQRGAKKRRENEALSTPPKALPTLGNQSHLDKVLRVLQDIQQELRLSRHDQPGQNLPTELQEDAADGMIDLSSILSRIEEDQDGQDNIEQHARSSSSSLPTQQPLPIDQQNGLFYDSQDNIEHHARFSYSSLPIPLPLPIDQQNDLFNDSQDNIEHHARSSYSSLPIPHSSPLQHSAKSINPAIVVQRARQHARRTSPLAGISNQALPGVSKDNAITLGDTSSSLSSDSSDSSSSSNEDGTDDRHSPRPAQPQHHLPRQIETMNSNHRNSMGLSSDVPLPPVNTLQFSSNMPGRPKILSSLNSRQGSQHAQGTPPRSKPLATEDTQDSDRSQSDRSETVRGSPLYNTDDYLRHNVPDASSSSYRFHEEPAVEDEFLSESQSTDTLSLTESPSAVLHENRLLRSKKSLPHNHPPLPSNRMIATASTHDLGDMIKSVENQHEIRNSAKESSEPPTNRRKERVLSTRQMRAPLPASSPAPPISDAVSLFTGFACISLCRVSSRKYNFVKQEDAELQPPLTPAQLHAIQRRRREQEGLVLAQRLAKNCHNAHKLRLGGFLWIRGIYGVQHSEHPINWANTSGGTAAFVEEIKKAIKDCGSKKIVLLVRGIDGLTTKKKTFESFLEMVESQGIQMQIIFQMNKICDSIRPLESRPCLGLGSTVDFMASDILAHLRGKHCPHVARLFEILEFIGDGKALGQGLQDRNALPDADIQIAQEVEGVAANMAGRSKIMKKGST